MYVSTTFSGPDSGSASVGGTCIDVAGNASAPVALRPQVRRHTPDRRPEPRPTSGRERLVQPRGLGRLLRLRLDLGIGLRARRRATAAPTRRRRPCRAPAPTRPELGEQLVLAPVRLDAARRDHGVLAAPHANGWYNQPVTVTATGTDTGSGIDSCSGVTYSGPDSPMVSLTASCVDKAGNTSTAPVTFKYDSTPPKLSDITVANGNGTATLRWAASPGVASITITRSAGSRGHLATVYKGNKASFTDVKLKNGIRYRYQLSATDAAGNVGQRQRDRASPGAREPRTGTEAEEAPAAPLGHGQRRRLLQRPALLPRPQGAERLAGRRKLALQASWKYSGDPHRLTKGTYRWYVWPGYGTRKAAHYGKLLGSGIFVVA